MINIRHKEYGPNDISYIANKYDDTISIKLNTSMIEDDINRLKGEIGKAKNKIDDKNIKALIHYLDNIKKTADKNNGTIEICWHIKAMDSRLPSSYPIQFISETLYKIQTSNYIELDNNQKYIHIDLISLANIMAYEFMFKDLGETHDSIEDMLKDCAMISYNDSSILENKFKSDGDNIYELSQTLCVGESSYLVSEVTRKLNDYFYTTSFSGSGKNLQYKDAINYSCRYASTIIMNTILHRGNFNNIEVKPLAISPTYIDLIVNVNDEDDISDVIKKLIDDIALQAFGREFIVHPTITIL